MEIEKQKAEAYVREKCPELHSNYCGVHNELKIPSAEWCTCDIPQLQHWLRVLGMNERYVEINSLGDVEIRVLLGDKEPKWFMNLDPITGQPATEADYQAFNEIVGV